MDIRCAPRLLCLMFETQLYPSALLPPVPPRPKSVSSADAHPTRAVQWAPNLGTRAPTGHPVGAGTVELLSALNCRPSAALQLS